MADVTDAATEDGEAPEEHQRMTLVEHLAELRSRLFKCIVAVVIGGVVCWIFYNQILEFLVRPYCDLQGGDCSLYVTVHSFPTRSSDQPTAENPRSRIDQRFLRLARVSVIHAADLRKNYGEVAAVDGVSFDVAPGESFGLLGPNGAGKSTTMRLIGGTLLRTSGVLEVLGLDPETHGPQVRASLGVVPQADNLDEELRARDNLIVYGRYFGLPLSYLRPKADELLEFAQLTDKASAKVNALSGGMKRRLTIARGLINEPRILLLDEPTTGLDPQARHILWDRLFRLKEQGVTLVVTTHFMDEAEQLCDRLVVMDHGRIVAEGSPPQLIRRFSTREVAEVRFGSERNAAMEGRLRDLLADAAGGARRLETLPDRLLVYADDGEAVLEEIRRRGLNPLTSLVRRSSLEDVFLRLTGRSLVD